MSDVGAYEWPVSPGLGRRFAEKVDYRGADECWPWLAFRNPRGYGMIRNGARMALAHRVAWALTHGRVPAGKHVLHTCDVPACVNPNHLYIGTNADNVRDKVARGRSSFPRPERRGERHPLAKLTWAQVEEIRAASTGLRGEGREFARKYGVSPASISNILQRKIWA